MKWKFGGQTETMKRFGSRAAGQRLRLPRPVCGYLWQNRGGILRRNILILGIAAAAVAGVLLAQEQPAKTSAKKSASHGGSSGSAAKGKEVFEKKCALCHFAESDQKKIGPGLKGISKRGTFTVNGNKVTSESLKTWIENGDSLMPPFKDVLEPAEIKEVVAYVKTL
jgi:cytochrome c